MHVKRIKHVSICAARLKYGSVKTAPIAVRAQLEGMLTRENVAGTLQ
jgi:hypothetical protein